MRKRCKNNHKFTGELAEDASFCPYCGDTLVKDTGPVTVDMYLHGSKESNYEIGEELGLTGEALGNFCYSLYEVKITLQVDPHDGSSKIVAVDDVPLSTT